MSSVPSSPNSPLPCRDRLRHLLRGDRQFRRHRRLLATRAPTRERARLASARVRRRSPGVPEALPVAGAGPRAADSRRASSSNTGTSRPHAGDTLEVADVVIEAFGCELPPVYVAAMAERERAPVWLNLEYLSAEDWVADFHLRPSPHPRYPLTKTFFFPGLGPGTGGVLKERHLDAARVAFELATAAKHGGASHRRRAAGRGRNGRLAVRLRKSGRRQPARTMARQRRAGRAAGAGRPHFRRGRPLFRPAVVCGRLACSARHPQRACARLHRAAGYDALLWASDINFVRGEDSFVRAQWAAKPFVWHIYPQADDAHLPKLDAALAHYARSLPADARDALARFWHAWNGAGRRTGPNSGATTRR